jgi:hypothetical protein
MNATKITDILQRIDMCGPFTEQEREFLKRAVLTYTAESVAHIVGEERAHVLSVVRRMVQSSHYLRIEQAVNDDVRRRTP